MPGAVESTLNNQINHPACEIKIGGAAASQEILNDLLMVVVEQSLYLPAMFVIKLHNRRLKWFDSDLFRVGMEITISMCQDTSDQKDALLLKGEITGLELDAAPRGTPSLTIRGYDRLHRLQRGRQTRSFLQVTDSDLVEVIAAEVGMQAEVSPTQEVYEYILQNNETNLEFLQRRVNRLGLELVANDKKLKLRERNLSEKGPTLEWGFNLSHFAGRLSSSQQVEEVVVRGWDAKTKQAIVGSSNHSDNQPRLDGNPTGKAFAEPFGSARTASVYRPIASQGEAEKLAQAIYDDLAGRFFQLEGACLGDGTLRPGRMIEIKNIGAHYSGNYYVTACTHQYSPNGYQTQFLVSGRQTQTLLEMTSQSGGERNALVSGTVIGVVTNNKDPENRGRVRVKFPWLSEETESNWARVVAPMAGSGRGFFFLPEVNDEVLLAFEQGDINRPYILGALWNGVDAPPKPNSEVVGSDGRVKERLIKTLSGHTVTFDDSDEAPKISIVDKTGQNKIIIESSTNKITIESEQGNIQLKAPMGKVSLDAMEIEINGATSAKMSSPQVQIDGSATTKVSGGMVEVKGGMVKLN